MNLRKFISGVSALAIAASAFAGMAVTASAAEATISAAQFVAVNGNDETTSVTSYTEVPVTIGQIKISGGKLMADSNKTWALARFDASAYADYTIAKAIVNYDVTAGTYNSGMALGTVEIASNWVAADANYSNVNGIYSATSLFNKNSTDLAYSEKGKTTTISYDVTNAIKSAISNNEGIVTFYIATTTGREQTLETVPSLTVTYADKELSGAATVKYTDGTKSIAADTSLDVSGKFEGDTVTYSIPKYIVNDGAIYVSDDTSYTKTATLTATAQDITKTYTATGTKGYFFEAEDTVSNGTANNQGYYSNGKSVRRLDQKQPSITIPETGIYNVTIGFSCDRSAQGTTDTMSVYSGSYSTEATPLWTVTVDRYDTYRGSSNKQENIALEAGSKLTLYTSSWNLGADYILLEKVPQAITVDEAITNGTVTSNVETAVSGDTVTLTVTPDANYELDTLTVTDTNNNAVELAANNTFTMPATAVTVTATFKSTYVPAADLSAAVTQTGVENGTEQYAADSATWFVITVTNAGDAEGTYNTVSITNGTATASASTPNATLAANAEVVYGGVIEGAYTFTGASVE